MDDKNNGIKEKLKKKMEDLVPLEQVPIQYGRSTFSESFLSSKPISSFCFKDISVTRKQGSWLQRKNKILLDCVSGFVHRGQILYIMGHSGCGKSTLLDTLFGKIVPSAGEIIINGGPLSQQMLTRLRYVPQHDHAYSCLSVKEAFDFERDCFGLDQDSTQKIAKILGLSDCIDTRFGGESDAGISSGQKRRLSIGVALLSRPGLLLLDEPTSGLDVSSATSLMMHLRKICDESGLPMIVVIHQPTQEIFELCDNCLILSEGRQGYFGSPHELGRYLERAQFPLAAKNLSVCEWAVNLLTKKLSGEDTESCMNFWTKENEIKFEELLEETTQEEQRHHFSLWFLMKRRFKLVLRDPSWNAFRIGLYWMLAFYCATLWLLVDSNLTQNIPETVGVICFLMLFLPFLSVSVIPAYVSEMGVVAKELSRGTYSVFIFCVEHFLYEVLSLCLLSTSCIAIVYFAPPLLATPTNFWILSAGLFMALLAADSLMLLLSTIFRNFLVAVTVGCMIFGVFFCVCSYFIPVQDVGWYWQWIKYINILYYSCSIGVVNQFVTLSFPPSCEKISACYPSGVNGTQIIESYGYDQRLWIPFVGLVCLILVFRMGHGAFLQFLKLRRAL